MTRDGDIEMKGKNKNASVDSPGNAPHGGRRVSKGNSDPADWEAVNPQILLRAIGRVARMGGALRLGYTRDGGAYAIGIYGDGDVPYTDYIRPSENIEEYLIALIESWG